MKKNKILFIILILLVLIGLYLCLKKYYDFSSFGKNPFLYKIYLNPDWFGGTDSNSNDNSITCS